ncbi:DUF2141 domain-containing protein [Lewinella sp. IMCC34183]|uniref:DUF2141 domain-containing protein n=1 Tax=Lewinella sp. IMCC34183 TaxID=2248762 RepID=UPI00130075D6|nr:DUF2141 domain-containing protein [Lewinella sp. IMCC34183]
MAYLILLLFPFLAPAPAAHNVDVQIVSSTTGGKFYVAAYATAHGFQEEEFVSNGTTEPADKATHGAVALQLPEAGEYVLAAFQDLNDNGELDRNFLGVPTEPYGFAKIPPSKWRSPSFDEVATQVDGSGQIRIELRPWSDY